MPSISRHLPVVAATVSALLVATLVWIYRGDQQPLSPDEVQHYLARIDAQPQLPGARHDRPALEKFLSQDDGLPFYTVNLYRFHERAQYADALHEPGTGEQAFERFSAVMLRLLARRASHPIFASDWSDASAGRWDRIVIVRYRSRRDIADLFATKEFAEASAHKWAALAEHERMLVQGLHVPELAGPGTVIALAILATCGVTLARRRRPPAPAHAS